MVLMEWRCRLEGLSGRHRHNPWLAADAGAYKCKQFLGH